MEPKSPQKIAEYGKIVRFEAGEEIYKADFLVGDPSVFLITDGKIEVVKKYTPLQKEIFEYGRGDIFGMLEVYTGTARLTDAYAITDAEAIGFNRADFEKAMTAHLSFALSSIRLLSKMLRQVNARIKTLG